MATVYYRQFSVLRIASNGSRVELPAEDVNVYNVTAATSLGTLTTDADGIIASGSFTATLFDVIEISHDTYPLTCRFTLQATEDEAFTALENNVACYIAENLYTDTTESKTAKLFVIDLDNAEVKPSFLTDVKPSEGIQKYIPQTASAQNLRIALISEDINGQLSTTEIATAPEYFDITIPAASGGGECCEYLIGSDSFLLNDDNDEDVLIEDV